MRILIVTDAWSPQVNGVVTTVRNTVRELEALGHVVGLITPEGFTTLPCPTYPEIRLALAAGARVARMIEEFEPDAVHLETEAPLGIAARRHCLASGRPFTTAYHTQFPEYVHARCRLPLGISYRWLRWFHGAAEAVLVPTQAIHQRLSARGFTNLAYWSRGVDLAVFSPAPREARAHERPIFLYAGRVAIEKSLEEFLRLDLPGTKWVVGDGPARAGLEARFPQAIFHGMKYGAELAYFYQQADAFVFPSRTDTFGLVLVEAMACGTPVAAYPVTGPIDVIRDPAVGVLSEDLRAAALAALELDRRAVRSYALQYSWATATRQFLEQLRPVPSAIAA
ncbi:MAG TPA: glycosyltransferase family 1 protein [Casimicrobiaceae bacterium]|jgi:glycosyltransferase involved in cell wall biosynthesis|nr:glycosyltransferase family 1 protein [Casimicrobiaceae bacterium]